MKTNITNQTIILSRDDLIKHRGDLPIEEIQLSDFKSTSISYDVIIKAGLIMFKDGNKTMVLKNRHPNGTNISV